MMNWIDILISSAIVSVVASFVLWILKEWLLTRMKQHIEDTYNRSFQRFKRELEWDDRKLQKATLVSELFSLWLKHAYDDSENENATKYLLQKKYWELALWLEPAVLRKINTLFTSNKPPGVRHKEVLIAIRKLVVGGTDDITPEELVHWDPFP